MFAVMLVVYPKCNLFDGKAAPCRTTVGLADDFDTAYGWCMANDPRAFLEEGGWKPEDLTDTAPAWDYVEFPEYNASDLSEEAFRAETEEYRTASRERRIELEAKWGARADYFRER